MSNSRLTLASETSQLLLSGYGTKLSAFDSFDVKLSNRGPYIGEYYGGSYAQESLNEHAGVQLGAYRLMVSHTGSRASYGSNITQCIPYNATVEEMASILEQLPIVSRIGGVTVRRYGSSSPYETSVSERYQYGFTYRIDMDGVPTSMFTFGGLSLSVYCYGATNGDCACAQTKVPLVDATGTPNCETSANFSEVTSGACVHSPTIKVTRISRQAYVKTSGTGTLKYTAGVHRLPPITSSVTIAGASSGMGIVAANTIQWYSMTISGQSRLMVAGTSWAGWDSVFDLFAADWDNERGLSALNRAPASVWSLTNFAVSELGSVFSTGPSSNFTWTRGVWNGGILGGRSTLHITESMVMNGTNMALRDVFTLNIDSTATATWISGNISLANAATIIDEGKLVIDNSRAAAVAAAAGVPFYPPAMGEAEYLNDSSSNAATSQLLALHPGRSWQSYYSSELIAELRAGWYLNPYCGASCGDTNFFIIQGNGKLVASDSSVTSFVLPVYFIDDSRFNLSAASTVYFNSGGTIGNDVVVTLGNSALLALSGGSMLMQATCTIQGAGDLQVTGGAHDLSFIIDARITISGGRLRWPQSRGEGKTITFRGGLIIESEGQLIVEPQSTTIQVESDVYFRDSSFIQFPVLGIAAQSTPFDGLDVPDTSPRCTLNATKVMHWDGGTIAGKVDIIALKFLYLDGDTKYVKSLAKLLNYGHCEWGEGDVVTSNYGDFVNYGTLQMKNGEESFSANAFYLGTALPVENGGDPFAKEFHTYDQDPGRLNYAEYVRLNGQYVSILPLGWTAEDQESGKGMGGLQ